jgi:hypothetical protein
VVNDDDAIDDRRPWEQPGAVRRDCEPHRGRLLLGLSLLPLGLYAGWHTLSCTRLGFVASGGSLPVGRAAVAAIDLTLTLGGAAAGAGVYAMTRRDLARMAAGQMDPYGKGQTVLAQMCAWLGIVAGLAQALGCVAVPLLRGS